MLEVKMKLKDVPLFSFGFVKKSKQLVTTQQKAKPALLIPEAGAVGINPFPMYTGFMKSDEPEVKKAWVYIHALKLEVYKYGQPTGMEAVVPISERSYMPLDPLGILTEKMKEKLASLKDIAKIRHAQQRAVALGSDPIKTLAQFVINGCFIIWGILAVIALLKGIF